jgi:hypothetical protein
VVRGNDQSGLVSTCLATAFVPTYALQVVQSVELGAQPTVYAQELLVHDGRQRQCAERVHACLVNGFRVFVLALELECEVVGQMPALVVAAEQPERVGVPDLQRPQVQNALRMSAHAHYPLLCLIPQY